MAINILALLVAILLFFNCTLATSFLAGSNNFFADLGGQCSLHSDCYGTVRNSYCPENFPPGGEVCKCLPGHFNYTSQPETCPDPSNLNDVVSCLPLANGLGDKCGTDLQCTSGLLGDLSHCINGTCQCLPTATYSEHHKICVLLATKLNQTCDSAHGGDQCKNIPYSSCKWGNCVCNEDRVESWLSPNTCVLGARILGDSCEEDEGICKTLPGTSCQGEHNKTCQCRESGVPSANGQRCFKIRLELDESCDVSAQCTVQNSYCQGFRCNCMPGYVQSSSLNNTCVLIGKEIGARCSEHVQCTAGLGNFSECNSTSNECQCKEDGVLHNSLCYPPAFLGEDCQFTEQCTADDSIFPDAEFLSLSCNLDYSALNESVRRCSCPKGRSEYEGHCYQNTALGFSCVYDEACKASLKTELVKCGHSCECIGGYMASKDKSRCIKENIALGDTCEETRQCSLVESNTNQYCDFGTTKCTCKKGFEVIGGSVCREINPTTTPSSTTKSTTSTSANTNSTTTPRSTTTPYSGATIIISWAMVHLILLLTLVTVW